MKHTNNNRHETRVFFRLIQKCIGVTYQYHVQNDCRGEGASVPLVLSPRPWWDGEFGLHVRESVIE